MQNKRGAEMAIGTIIVIILAVIVLVFLVYGFSVGWGNLFDKVSNFGGGQSNVQTVVQSCGIACTTQAEYDYSTLKRNVKFGDGTEADVTCSELEKKVEAKAAYCKDESGNVVADVDENGCANPNTWVPEVEAREIIISPVCQF